MIHEGEQELICDLAETYHIYDYRSCPVRLVATLSAGLRDDSRIKMKLSGEKYPRDLVVQAMIVDRITVLQYGLFQIKEKPKLLCEYLFPDEKKESRRIPDLFDTYEDFRAEYDRIVNGGTI